MFESLIEYWGNREDRIHPEDKDLIKTNEREERDAYKLHLDLYPEPYMGNLSNPRIVFLYLNPGFNEKDNQIHNEIKDKNYMGKALQNNLDQFFNDAEYPFLWLDEKYKDSKKEDNPGAFYWNRLINQKTGTSFLECMSIKMGISEEDTRKWLAKNICDIELFPYHSVKFNKDWCFSNSVSKAREAVIEAIKQTPNTVFVFMRSFALWLPESERSILQGYRNVIVNKSVRNPSLNPALHPKNGEICVGKRIFDFLFPGEKEEWQIV